MGWSDQLPPVLGHSRSLSVDGVHRNLGLTRVTVPGFGLKLLGKVRAHFSVVAVRRLLARHKNALEHLSGDLVLLVRGIAAAVSTVR